MLHRDVDASSQRARLIILSTGGTIAMTTGTAQTGAARKLSAAHFAGAVPRLAYLADVEALDVLAKPSADFTLADIAAIADAAKAAAKTGAGIVITHGTDTLEESAFALSLLVQVDQPIVFTAAMRRPDQPGADGPANLLAAAVVAISPAARGKGILVVADDEIHAGPLIRKAHSFRPHAFSSLPFGPIGYVAEERVRFALVPASRPPRLTYGRGAPVVPILEAGPGLETQTVEALAAGAIDGLVLGLPGAGHAAASAVPALARLAERIPVVFASRTGAGETLRGSYDYPGGEIDLIGGGLIPANALDARKARIALQLLLSNQADLPQVRTIFERF
ncbi:MAG: asparaginase [Methylocella sp.]